MTFSQGYRKLSYAYTKGLVAYPRVANNYIEPACGEHPHPPLKTFDLFSEPIMEDSVIFSWQSLPIFLTNEHISTPATLMKNLATADKFFDKDLRLKKECELLARKKLAIYERFRGLLARRDRVNAKRESCYRVYTLSSSAFMDGDEENKSFRINGKMENISEDACTYHDSNTIDEVLSEELRREAKAELNQSYVNSIDNQLSDFDTLLL